MNFKSIFKKQNILPVAVLLAICIVVAGVLGAVNLLTADRIADNENAKIYESLTKVLDGHITPLEKLPEGTPKSVTGIYEVRESSSSTTLKGKIVTVVVKGYAGDIAMTVGVKADGTVSKVIITSQSESHGKAGMSSYPDKFAGVSAENVGSVDLFTGATVSSTAIRNGVADAVKAAMGTSEPEPEKEVLPKTDEEILELAGELVGDGVSFTDVTPDDGETVKRVYKVSESRGYVAYLVVMSRYGTPESETLVHFDNSGKIVSVEKLVWSPSPANPDYGYYPPAEDVVDAFYAKFVGHNSASFTEKFVKIEGVDKEVEHAAGATTTSNNVAVSIAEAFTFVDELIRVDIPRAESEVIAFVKELLGEGVSFTDVTPDSGEYVKRIYKANGNKGYVAYLVVMSRYGTPETETLVHFGSTGKILAVKKLVWSPSPANPDYGYYPPSEEVVDAFYAKFVGHGSASFTEKFVKIDGVDKEVEHAAGATSTSNNVASAIAKAFTFVDELVKKDLPREESEIIDYAGELTGEDTLEDVTPGNTVFVKRLYKLGGNKGYVAYVVVISGYGTPETETLVHFDNTGKIAAVKKIVWSPSPANPDYPFYQPPTEDVVDAFYAKFVGHNSASFTEKFVKIEGVDKEIEHAAGTTTTSNNLANAIAEAFSYVDEMNGGEATGEEEVSYAARIIGIVILCASFAAVAAIIITKSIKRRRAK